MPKRLEIQLGTKYNMWTLVREVPKLDQGRRFLCRCDCGTEKELNLVYLRMGRSISCGCNRIRNQQVAGFERTKEAIGMQFGLLTVIQDLGNNRRYGARTVKCQCGCGKTVNKNLAVLLRGDCKSCGCLNSQLSSERMHRYNGLH